ncbi:uncharacterized protein SPPG_06882 [Spizellomyces punctatus DAOM BR117]|uniref:Uncharacterized protein n=1 Tax=Spizellomyces punctatus (strain DAOM BR117) TaxID=645134 RepID=A0A0L0HA54_SPIPD|nr:uncharacterized protein SPPG_06882 [Spizellomyces punctatus DAOM BR117]KNC97891.1 hypothetical protein SPPG_06882 [Spizellomyces punctatus DAOM BR117]|eukprot:XP_016605931.1 hypothetical protein SPPG_06882 [Spizellomyces punctatus DAOM BR117]
MQSTSRKSSAGQQRSDIIQRRSRHGSGRKHEHYKSPPGSGKHEEGSPMQSYLPILHADLLRFKTSNNVPVLPPIDSDASVSQSSAGISRVKSEGSFGNAVKRGIVDDGEGWKKAWWSDKDVGTGTELGNVSRTGRTDLPMESARRAASAGERAKSAKIPNSSVRSSVVGYGKGTSRPTSARGMDTSQVDMTIVGGTPPLVATSPSPSPRRSITSPQSHMLGNQQVQPRTQSVFFFNNDPDVGSNTFAASYANLVSDDNVTDSGSFFFKADRDMQFDLQEATTFMRVLQKESRVRFVALDNDTARVNGSEQGERTGGRVGSAPRDGSARALSRRARKKDIQSMEFNEIPAQLESSKPDVTTDDVVMDEREPSPLPPLSIAPEPPLDPEPEQEPEMIIQEIEQTVEVAETTPIPQSESSTVDEMPTREPTPPLPAPEPEQEPAPVISVPEEHPPTPQPPEDFTPGYFFMGEPSSIPSSVRPDFSRPVTAKEIGERICETN